MKEPLEFFVATIGWVLFVFVLIGVLHVAAVMESNALKLQDMHLKNDTSDKRNVPICVPTSRSVL